MERWISREYRDEARSIMALAWPIQLTNLLDFGLAMGTILVVGRLPTAIPLGAAALGNLYTNFTGIAILVGMAGAIDTLSSQACGAKAYGRVGAVTQRSMAILCLMCVPIGFLWLVAGQIFTALGQEAEPVALATEYVQYMLWGLVPTCLYECLKRHLQAVGLVGPPTVISVVACLFNLVLGIILVHFTPMGFVGAPLAISVSRWLMFGLALGYHLRHRQVHGAMERLRARVGGLLGSSASSESSEIKSKNAPLPEGSAAASAQRASDSGANSTSASSLSSSPSSVAVVVEDPVSGRVQFATLTGQPISSLQDNDVVISSNAGTPSVSGQVSSRGALSSEHNLLRSQSQLAVVDDAPIAVVYSGDSGGGLKSVPSDRGSNIDRKGANDVEAAPAPPSPSDYNDAEQQPQKELDRHALLDATWSSGLHWRFALSGWPEFLSLGAPSALMLLVEWGSFEAQSLIAGVFSTTVLAAHTVLATTSAFAFMVILGFSIAAGIRVGQRMGENQPTLAGLTYRTTLMLGACSISLNALFILSVRPVWGEVFTDDGDVVGLVSTWLPLLALFTIPDTLQGITSGTLRGLGFPGVAAAGNVLSSVVVGLPVSYGLCIGAGPWSTQWPGPSLPGWACLGCGLGRCWGSPFQPPSPPSLRGASTGTRRRPRRWRVPRRSCRHHRHCLPPGQSPPHRRRLHEFIIMVISYILLAQGPGLGHCHDSGSTLVTRARTVSSAHRYLELYSMQR